MPLLALFATLVLIFLHLAGVAAVMSRHMPHYLLAKAAAVMTLVLVSFFIEHFVGLGKLSWAWPITSLLAIYIVWQHRQQFKEQWWKSELVFILAFLYGFAWRFTYPLIYPTSERVTDLYFISNYMEGTRLPPVDKWLPQLDFTFYYAFQHYAASLMGRLFGLEPGVTYNIAFALLNAFSISMAWCAASFVCPKVWQRVLIVAAFTVGGTGVSPIIHFVDNHAGTHQAIQDGETLWASMRFIGGYDQHLDTAQPPPFDID